MGGSVLPTSQNIILTELLICYIREIENKYHFLGVCQAGKNVNYVSRMRRGSCF